MARIASMNRKTKGEIIFGVFNVIILCMIVLVILYPMIYVVSASFSNPMEVISGNVKLFPKSITFKSYKAVFSNPDIVRGYMNTIFITVVGTSLNIVLTVMAAYPLSRKDLYGRNAIMMLFTFTMFFSGGIIPTYLVIQKLGLINSIWSLILPVAISTYNLIIMRTYFQNSIPYELQEAARIDGCTNIGVLIKIVLPLSGPILAVITLYYMVAHWNSYFSAMMYLTDRKLFPLQLILREILVNSQMQEMMSASDGMAEQALIGETIKYSVIVVSSLPMLLIYPLIQKFFVKGIMIGSVKG